MKSMAAAGQLPPAIGPPPRSRTTAIRINAPEAMRTEVKVAASIVVSLRASRHSRELPAKASTAKAVRSGRRTTYVLAGPRAPASPAEAEKQLRLRAGRSRPRSFQSQAGLEARGPAKINCPVDRASPRCRA